MAHAPDVSGDILRKLKDGAGGVRSAGEGLTTRVKTFESWIGKQPGRVEAECSIGTDPDGNESTYLSLVKDGKEWALYLYEFNHQADRCSARRLLRDASISDKVWAIPHFPNLLEAMVKAQTSLVEQAAQSAGEFDEFAKTIGLKGGA